MASFVCWFQGRFCPWLFPRWARRTGRTQPRSRPLPSAIMAMIQSTQGSALPQHTESGKETSSLSLLMELKAKGVFVQRRDHQPLKVGSSSSEPHLTMHCPPTAISKWLLFCAWRQRPPHRVEEPDRARFASVGAADHTYSLLSLAWTGVEKFSMLQFWLWFIFSFTCPN